MIYIFVADEQDICAKAPEGVTLKVDPQNGERKSFVKYCIEENIKWKDAIIGGNYTYKITPQIVLDKLKAIKGDMPLVVGGVLYDELSQIPTGNEDEIGYGYLETIRLAKGINVDLASGDYRDGLTRLGKLATTSFDAPQSFDLSVIPDESSIEAFVDDISVAFTYDSLANKVFLSEERSALSTARIEYCEKLEVNTPPVIALNVNPLEGTAPLAVTFDASSSTDDKGITSFSLLIKGETLFNTDGLFTYTFNEEGSFEATLKATDTQGLTSSETVTIKVNPAPIAPVANFSISKSSERAPSVVTINASSSTDADSTIESFSLSVNGEVTTQNTPVFTINADSAGSFNLILTVTDSQGLLNQKTGSFEILPALVSPIADFNVTPESGRVPLQVVVDASSSSDSDGEISKYDLYVNDQLVSQTTPIFNFNVDTATTYNLRLVVTDNDGLTSEKFQAVTYEAPLVPPVAALSATPGEAEVPFEITLDASASSDSDGNIVNYVFSDGTNVVSSTSPTLTFVQETPGTYNYTVEVTDNDGLKATAEASVIAKPKTTQDSSALASYFKYNVIPTGEDNYNLELIYEGRSFNDKTITEAFYSTPEGTRLDVGRRVLGHVDIIPITFGEFDTPIEITLAITDELGGNETFTRSIDPNDPRLLMFVDAIEYAPNSIVLFSNKFHDPYNQLDGFASFEIDYGDGTVIQSEGSSFQLTHAYPAPGEYNISITARGENGESFSITDSITVVGETAPFEFPLADFRVEKADFAPGVRLYVDQSLSPNAPIMTYLWELGDGTTAYGPEVVHFYNAGGYDVTLTAILEDGSQSLVKREVIIMNDAPNIVSNLECFDIGNLTLECEFIAADKFNDLASLNVHFGDSPLIPENIISQSVSGGFETLNFTYTYESSGNYDLTYQVQTGRGEELLKFTNASVSDAPGNLPPVADLGCFTFFDQVDCQAFGSFDPDGFITQYKFSFGNGESLTTDSAQTFYTYPEVGTYTVTLEVTDNLGTTSSTSQVVTLEERVNQFPVPHLTCNQNELKKLTCSGVSSFDTDGTIVNVEIFEETTQQFFQTTNPQDSFDFLFPESGNYEITLIVTDDGGASVETKEFYFVDSNEPPLANFNCAIKSKRASHLLACSSTSTDADGSILTTEFSINNSDFRNTEELDLDLISTPLSSEIRLRVTDDGGKTGLVKKIVSDFITTPVPDFSIIQEENLLKLDAGHFNTNVILPTYNFYIDNLGPFASLTGELSYPVSNRNELTIRLEITDNLNNQVEVEKSFTPQFTPRPKLPRILFERIDGGLSSSVKIYSDTGADLLVEVNGESVQGNNIDYFFSDFGQYEFKTFITDEENNKLLLDERILNYDQLSISTAKTNYWQNQLVFIVVRNIGLLGRSVEVTYNGAPVDISIEENSIALDLAPDIGDQTYQITIDGYETSLSFNVKEYIPSNDLFKDYSDFVLESLDGFAGLGTQSYDDLKKVMIDDFEPDFRSLNYEEQVQVNKDIRSSGIDGIFVDEKFETDGDSLDTELITSVDNSSWFIKNAYAQDMAREISMKENISSTYKLCRRYINESLSANFQALELSNAGAKHIDPISNSPKLLAKIAKVFQVLSNPVGSIIQNFYKNVFETRAFLFYAQEAPKFYRCANNIYFPSANPSEKFSYSFVDHDPSDGAKFYNDRYVFLNKRFIKAKIRGYNFKSILTQGGEYYPELAKRLRKRFEILKNIEDRSRQLQSQLQATSCEDFYNKIGSSVNRLIDLKGHLDFGKIPNLPKSLFLKSCNYLSESPLVDGSVSLLLDNLALSNLESDENLKVYQVGAPSGQIGIVAKRTGGDFKDDFLFSFTIVARNPSGSTGAVDFFGGRNIESFEIKGISRGGCPDPSQTLVGWCNPGDSGTSCSGGLISENATIDPSVFISSDSRVCGNSIIEGDVEVLNGSIVDNSKVLRSSGVINSSTVKNSTIEDVAFNISEDVEILNNSKFLPIPDDIEISKEIRLSKSATVDNSTVYAGSFGGSPSTVSGLVEITDSFVFPRSITGPSRDGQYSTIKGSNLGADLSTLQVGEQVLLSGSYKIKSSSCNSISITNANEFKEVLVENSNCFEDSSSDPRSGIVIITSNEVSAEIKNSNGFKLISLNYEDNDTLEEALGYVDFDRFNKLSVERISGSESVRPRLTLIGNHLFVDEHKELETTIEGDNVKISRNSQVGIVSGAGIDIENSKASQVKFVGGSLNIKNSSVGTIDTVNGSFPITSGELNANGAVFYDIDIRGSDIFELGLNLGFEYLRGIGKDGSTGFHEIIIRDSISDGFNIQEGVDGFSESLIPQNYQDKNLPGSSNEQVADLITKSEFNNVKLAGFSGVGVFLRNINPNAQENVGNISGMFCEVLDSDITGSLRCSYANIISLVLNGRLKTAESSVTGGVLGGSTLGSTYGVFKSIIELEGYKDAGGSSSSFYNTKVTLKGTGNSNSINITDYDLTELSVSDYSTFGGLTLSKEGLKPLSFLNPTEEMINSSMLPTQESGRVVFKANGGLVRYIGSLSQISMDGGRLIVREPSSVSNLNLINSILEVKAINNGFGTLDQCGLIDSEQVLSGDLSCEP